MPLVDNTKLTEYKTLPQYDTLWVFLGVFIPCPMSQAKTQPDFIIGKWGFSSTIALSKFHIPIGLVFLPIMILLAIIF